MDNLVEEGKIKLDRKAYGKKYYADKKEEWKALYGSDALCECGATISKYNLSSHKRTEKHRKALDEKNLTVIEALQKQVSELQAFVNALKGT